MAPLAVPNYTVCSAAEELLFSHTSVVSLAWDCYYDAKTSGWKDDGAQNECYSHSESLITGPLQLAVCSVVFSYFPLV